MEIAHMRRLGILQTQLDVLCKNNKVYPIYLHSNNFIDLDGNVYEVGYQQTDFVMNKIKPVDYTKNKKIPVYMLYNDQGKYMEKISLYRLYLSTFYGVVSPNCKIRYSNGVYYPEVISEIRWKIDTISIINDDMVLINGVEFKRFYQDSEHPTKYYVNQCGAVYNHELQAFCKYTFAYNYYVRIQLKNYLHQSEDAQYQVRYSIHRLIYSVWKNDSKWIDPDIQINHIDGFKNHNWLSNLELCTGLENLRHARVNNLRTSAFTLAEIHQICKYLEANIYTPTEISEILGRSYNSIRWVIKGIMKKEVYYDISSQYNLESYRNTYHGSDVKEEEIRTICDLYVNQHKDRKIIHEITGRSPNLINRILRCEAYPEIGKGYGLPIHEIRSVMNADQVREICEFAMANGSNYTIYELADHFGRKYSSIRAILTHKTMPEITNQYDFSKVYPHLKKSQPILM